MKTKYVSEFWKLIRFSIVGGLATVVYLAGATMAVMFLRVSPVVAGMIGFLFSVTISYIGHFHFTFIAPGRYRDYVVKFGALAVASFLLSTGLMWLLTQIFKLDYRIALTTVAIIIPIVSYLMNRFWVFLHPSDAKLARPPLKAI